MTEGIQTAYRQQLIESSRAKLMASNDVPGKANRRARILAEHPEYQLRVNTERLKGIIPYVDFKCHPKSSIARGEAIRSSDIDGGVVILPGRLDPEAQLIAELDFVQELRDQGFDVYHEREYSELDERFIAASEEDKVGLIPELVKRTYNMLNFYTELELEQMTRARELPQMAMIYLAGVSIPQWPAAIA